MSPRRSGSTSATPASSPNETRSSTGVADRGVKAYGASVTAPSWTLVATRLDGSADVMPMATNARRASTNSGRVHTRCQRLRSNVWSCVSINDVTVRMAWLAGLAVVALVLAGWRKTARAQPKGPRSPVAAPRRVPVELTHSVARPYHAAGPLRRVWAAVASGGHAV